MRTTYRSKIDVWLGVILMASAIIALAAACFVLIVRTPGSVPLAVFLSATGTVLPIWLLADTKYVMEEHGLLIRSGPFRWRIPYKDIRKVEPTRSPMSGPALSLDRVRIDYGAGRSCMVSPKDRQGFIAEIQRLAGAAA